MNNDFKHQQYAHCESGVMSNLLKHQGLEISEPMALGLTSALTFAYIPFVKINGQPLIAYRMPPKWIINGLRKRLKINLSFHKFNNQEEGMQALDKALEKQQLVGMQGSVYWLPYFPADMRFHFNAHNLIVYGKSGDNYLVSDPIFDKPMETASADLKKARFAKGALAAKGLMYIVHSVPETIDFDKVIRKAIANNVKIMIGSPVPIVGIKGIRYLAKKIRRIDQSLKDDRAIKLFLGNIIRMQEEIGTGGAGFRFIYASFLQEASQKINEPMLLEASRMMTEAGDNWREFALLTAKMCKKKQEADFVMLSDALLQCADAEEKVWRLLKTL
jgi:hypothetical protein